MYRFDKLINLKATSFFPQIRRLTFAIICAFAANLFLQLIADTFDDYVGQSFLAAGSQIRFAVIYASAAKLFFQPIGVDLMKYKGQLFLAADSQIHFCYNLRICG